MRSLVKLLPLPFVALAIGCGTGIRDRSHDYLLAEDIKAMDVPAEKDSGAIGSLYDIPDIPEAGATPKRFSLPRPHKLAKKSFENAVSIKTLDGKRWISVAKTPAEVWPRVRNILSRSGVPTTRVDATNGIIDTGWVQFKDDDVNSHRFRYTITPGMGINSTEVALLQMSAPLGKESQHRVWPNRSTSDSRESEFVRITADALASDINSGTVSLLAQRIGGEDRVALVTPEDGGSPYIRMKYNRQRAWLSLVDALNQGGFSVTQQQPAEGKVMVDFKEIITEEELERTLMDVVLSLGQTTEKELPAVPYQVSLAQVPSAEQGQEIQVVVNSDIGETLDPAVAKKLLRLIRNNLN